MSRSIERLLSEIFFLFFVCQILSPSFNEVSLYLELIVAIINPFFWFWVVKNIKFNVKILACIALLCITVLFSVSNFFFLAKVLALAISVLFLFYAKDRELFYLMRYLKVSIFVAVFQFVLLFIEPRLAFILGPRSISSFIWGEYAIRTFTNFYTIFFFPRVSGLSREAGFFASLLVGVIFLKIFESKRDKGNFSTVDSFFLGVGYLISFSKMSLVIFPVLILSFFKRVLDRIAMVTVIGIFLIVMISIWTMNKEFLEEPKNKTYIERFGSYATIISLNSEQLIFGEKKIENVKTSISRRLIAEGDGFGGFGGFIINYGLLLATLVLLCLFLLGISNTGVMILILLTINVQIETNQNFVTLAYFIIFSQFRKNVFLKKF